MKFFLVFLLALLIYIVPSCKSSGSSSGDTTSSEQNNQVELKHVSLINPAENSQFALGAKIVFKAEISDTSFKADSLRFLVDGKYLATLKNAADSFEWDTRNAKLGYKYVEVVAFSKGVSSFDKRKIFIKNTYKPIFYKYRVVKEYPHDDHAYTQGLVYENNSFLEGTGQYGESSLRSVELLTGKVTRLLRLPDNIFGEGIAVFDNKILQISWQEQVAFLYNKETFQQINKFYYPIREGWGLTYNGNNLIMSDGSSTLYFMDKEYFTMLDKVDVYDNNGPVRRLNELEYINGEVWANVYTTDTIVRINPLNGVVTGKIILSGLLKETFKNENTDVLNGIAYDNSGKRIFVTGKNWPKLFQIEIYKMEP